MRSKTFLTLALPIAASLLLVQGCAGREQLTPLYPPAADLRVEAKPRLDPSDVGSEAALDRHDIELELWGERGWAAVARICRWSVANGARLPFECPAPDPG